MVLSLYVLVSLAVGVYGQASTPEEFCSNPPAVYRGDHFEIVVNQTEYDYNRGIQVTVKPKPGGTYRSISDFFLYVPGTQSHPGEHGTNFVGKWYAMSPAAPAYCDHNWLASGVKSTYPAWTYPRFTATWVAPTPRYYMHNNRYYSYPGDKERSRPHIYFALYVTPDPPTRTWAPGTNLRNQRKWYFAHSVKIENREIKAAREREEAQQKMYNEWANMMESMN